MGDILNYVYSSGSIKGYIRKLLETNPTYKFDSDDLMSHILVEVNKKDLSEMIRLYNNNGLDHFIKVIIRNQLKSKTSSLHKEYSLVYKSGTNNLISDFRGIDIEYQGQEYDMVPDFLLDKIDEALRSVSPTKALLFRMYYYDDMTYSDIAREIGIDKQVVRLNVIKVLGQVREWIENNLENDNDIN